MMVADGEGAERIARVVVRGGHLASAEAVARAVANSPLVKTALHGGDPNWGRIVQAVGAALPGTAPLAVDVSIEGIRVCPTVPRSRMMSCPSSRPCKPRSWNTRSACRGRGPKPRSSSQTSATSTSA